MVRVVGESGVVVVFGGLVGNYIGGGRIIEVRFFVKVGGYII